MKKYLSLIGLLGLISFSGATQAQTATNPVLIKALDAYLVKEGANPIAALAVFSPPNRPSPTQKLRKHF